MKKRTEIKSAAEKKLASMVKPQPGAYRSLTIWDDGNVTNNSPRMAQLSKALETIDTGIPAQTYSAIQQGVEYLPQPIPMDTFLTALRYAYHYRACATRAKFEAGVSYSINENMKPTEDQEVVKFVDQLGYGMNIQRLLRRLRFDRRAYGNAYGEVIMNILGQPVQIRRLNPIYMYKKPEKIGGGFVQRVSINGIWQSTEFKEWGHKNEKNQKGQNAVFHWKFDDPMSDEYGLPPIVNAWDALMTLSLISESEHAHFANKAMPNVVVTASGVGWQKEDDEKIFKTFKELIKGTKNTSRTVILREANPEAKITITPLNPQGFGDEYAETRKIRRAEVLTADDVDPAMAGIIETGALAGDSTLEQQNNFKQDVAFDQIEINQTMNEIIQRRLDTDQYDFKISTYGSMVGQTQSNIDVAEINAGIKTRNMILKERGLEPSELEEDDLPLPYWNRQQDLTFPGQAPAGIEELQSAISELSKKMDALSAK